VGPRPDGYHELETIFHGIGLGDDIEIVPTASKTVELEMSLAEGMTGEIPEYRENLAWIASRRLIEKGANNAGVSIRITKRIPIAAGLGGGSGNAAGILVVLNELWRAGHDRNALLELALSVGSDVSYCITGGTTLATSRGEKLTGLPAPEAMWFVLGIDDEPLLTTDVYAAWDDLETVEEMSSAPMALALGAGDVEEVAALLYNALEPAAFALRPDLEAKKERLRKEGALGACMTGSGPTLYAVARDESHARSIASRVEDDFNRVMVVTTHPECIEWLD
jgi:4-diphosphocytidyl-2-C-methyl-D-erythritol kinase